MIPGPKHAGPEPRWLAEMSSAAWMSARSWLVRPKPHPQACACPPMGHSTTITGKVTALRWGDELRNLEAGTTNTLRDDRNVMGAERLLSPVTFIEEVPVLRPKPLEVIFRFECR